VGVAVPVAALGALAALTAAVLWYTYVVRDPAKVAELSRQIDALLDEIANLFKGQPLPAEVEEAKRQAEEALEKARKKKPDPDPKPYPPPLLPPNRGPDPYERDRKRDECEKKKKQYGWGTHSEVQRITGSEEQSHHVLQDAHFTSGRGYGLTNICGGYHTDDAPAIPVEGGTYDRDSPHGKITQAQRQLSDGYARRFVGPPPGPRPTLSEATTDGMGLLAKHTALGSDPTAMACLLEYINDYFKRTCPSLTQQSPLRVPWMRPADSGP
jgi:hypothetical protein